MTKTKRGCRRRLNQVAEKAEHYRGFGNRIPSDSPKTHWYFIEYNRETDEDTELVELHWLKVQEPSKDGKLFVRTVRNLLGIESGVSEVQFLATCWVAYSMSKTETLQADINAAFLFPATKMGDTTIRTPVAQVYGLHSCYDSKVLGLVFRYCEIAKIVPGEKVSLTQRK